MSGPGIMESRCEREEDGRRTKVGEKDVYTVLGERVWRSRKLRSERAVNYGNALKYRCPATNKNLNTVALPKERKRKK